MNCPTDASNLCDDEVIRDPWPHYTRLREKGPVVWMEALGNYAFTQYDVVNKGLRDHETLYQGSVQLPMISAASTSGAILSRPIRHVTQY